MTNSSPLTIKDSIAALALPESFAEAHIPLREVLENNMFLLNNGDLGVVYEFEGIYDEPLSYGSLQDEFNPFYKFLRQIALGIPATEGLQNTVVQIICSQRALKTPPPKSLKNGNYSFSDNDIGNLLQKEEESLFKLGLVERKFYLAIRYVVPLYKSGILAKLGTSLDIFRSEETHADEDISQLEKHRRAFEMVLEPLELEISVARPLSRLGVKQIFAYYHNVLHGGVGGQLLFTETKTNLQENIYNPKLTATPAGFTVHHDDDNKTEVSCFSLSQLPQEYSIGLFRNFIDSIPCKQWDLVWTFSNGSGSTPKEVFAKMWWFEKGAGNRPKYENLSSFHSHVSNTSPCGKQSVKLIAYGMTKTQASILQTNSLDYIGARLVPERQIGVHLLATALPLGCLPHQNSITGRHRSIRLENALGFLPIYAGPDASKGTRWWVSRSGLPTRFDLFAGEGNRMTAVIGKSRAGKSCLTSQLLLEFMERHPDSIIRFIDKKTSYKKLADLFGGKIIQFSEEILRKNPYSPFALQDWDTDDIENLYVIIASAILQKNPGAKFTAIHSEILLEAIKIAYNMQAKNNQFAALNNVHVSPHPLWADVRACLDQAAHAKDLAGADRAADEIAEWTVSLEETGQYGFLFSRHEKSGMATESARFLVYDLDGIPDPVLRQLAGQMAFLKICRDLAKQPRSVPKLVGIDEFGMLLIGDDEQTQKMNDNFVKNIVKTAAKYNTIVMSITNDVADYAEKPAGRTMWAQACHKIFLPLGKDMVGSLNNAYPNQFSDADIQILNSLEISRPLKRSQVYVKSHTDNGSYTGSMFVPLTPYMDAVVTTDPTPSEFYEDLRNKGHTAAEAIAFMAEQHPYGQGIVTKSAENRGVKHEKT